MENEKEYCICRSTDIDRFMIMCDRCEEWFHGDCINLSERTANAIKYYYCKFCIKKDPTLKIRYKKSKKEKKLEAEKKKIKIKSKKSSSSSTHDHSTSHKHREKSRDHPKAVKKEKHLDVSKLPSFNQKKSKVTTTSEVKTKSRLKISDDDDDVDYMNTKIKIEPSAKPEKHSSTKSYESTKDKEDNTPKQEQTAKVSSGGCGNCENCLRTEDCGRCDICHDIEKYGPATANNEICRLRRCWNNYDDDEEEEVIVKKEKQPEPPKISHAVKRQASADRSGEKSSKSKRRSEKKQEKKDKKKLKRKMTEISMSSIEDLVGFTTRRNAAASSLKPSYVVTPSSSLQCYGPQCIHPARLNSKYCSDDCGRKLANARLAAILPQRIKDWNSSPTVADEIARIELKRINSVMEKEKEELERLEEKFRKLEAIITTARKLSIDEQQGAEDFHNELDHYLIYCPICGQQTNVKNATKHMDRCYNKMEALTSFGSIFPTKIDGVQRLFCDVLNEQQRTYCKRLQVLCPEHTKEPKIGENEVCGCPLNSSEIYTDKFDFKPESFCRQAKKKCNKHFKWETMYRAEVDLQRIRQWLKIDEIFDEERKIKTAMSNRAGVMSLLLHQTTRHDLDCVNMRTKPTVSKKQAYKMMI